MANIDVKTLGAAIGASGGGSGSDKVFIATYGTSTASEVAAALTAGKMVACKYTRSSVDVHWLYLVDETDGKYVFAEASVTTNDGATSVSGISAALNKNTNAWEVVTGGANVETTTNKVTALGSSATDTQYPSAKCVYDAIAGYYVGALVNDSRYGSVTGGGIVARGSSCTLVATAASGCSFLAWKDSNGNILSTETSYTFTPTSDIGITAFFSDSGWVKIVSWADGSDEQLAAMVAAHYEGTIDLHDFWSVGDTRRVSLSAMSNLIEETAIVGETHAAQDVDFVLMDATLDGIKLASDGTTTPAFAVGMKEALANAGYMNSTATNVGGWDGCARRTWCNQIFANALPAVFKSIFKQFKWSLYGGSGASPTLTESTDLFALPAEKMIFGARSYSHVDEAAQFNLWSYYATAENRIKKRGISGSAGGWWGASPGSGGAAGFCGVSSSGAAGDYYAGGTYGLAPFGCL